MKVLYGINEDKKTVTCMIKLPKDSLRNEFQTIFKKEFNNEVLMGLNYTLKPYAIKGTYIGVARCSDVDTFDEEIGKKVAYRKAMLAMAKERIAMTKQFKKKVALLTYNVDKRIANVERYNESLKSHFERDGGEY